MKELTAKDFRIGNWVQNNLGTEYQVKAEHILMYHQQGGFFDKPIPLTEEWLIKFGFEKRESSTCNAWYIGKNEITHDWLFDMVWLHRPELINAPNFPFYRNGRHLIKYVHQLQNLYFALTNEELIITQ